MNRPALTLTTLALLFAMAAPAAAQRGDASADFVAAQKSRGATAAVVAAELQKAYREPSERIASLLIGAGYRPASVLTTMVVDLRFPLASATEDVGRGGASVVESVPGEAEEMAQALSDAGYTAPEVADVLVQLYDADSEEVAAALKTAGYGVGLVAEALRIEFGADASAAVAALRTVGFECHEAYDGISSQDSDFPSGPSGHVGDPRDYVTALYVGGCSRQEVQDTLEQFLPDRHAEFWLSLVLIP